MLNNKISTLGTASIPKLILSFSIPAIISMIIESLYNIVDRYFVGQGVGYLGIAGITLCFPISLFIMALSMVIGVGANTLFSIRLGEKKYEQARIILNNALTLLILMALFSFTFGTFPIFQNFSLYFLQISSNSYKEKRLCTCVHSRSDSIQRNAQPSIATASSATAGAASGTSSSATAW